MNRYYTYNPETKQLSAAPRVITRDGATIILGNPADYARYLDAYPRAEMVPPSPREGQYAVADGYELAGGAWHIVWRWVDVPSPTVADYDAAMEAHLTAERSERGYTTREPDMYINSQVPRWASDARDWVAHRDDVMLYALDILNAVAAGEPAPSLEEFKAGLPLIGWTDQEGD
ncbi:MAG: hypothetical protein J6V72_20760 [Kiritimatiellae bacterium]|nr:hypothetical protein [Kiritimatiellia bacterium]